MTNESIEAGGCAPPVIVITPAASGLELPELPEGAYTFGAAWSGKPAFTADQMHAYARKALAAQPAPGVGGDGLDFEPDDMHTVSDMANVGYSLMQAIKRNCPDYAYNESPAEIVADLMNERDEARATRPAESVAQGGEANVTESVFEAFMDHVDPIGRLLKWESHDHQQIKEGLRIAILAATPTPATGSGGEAPFGYAVDVDPSDSMGDESTHTMYVLRPGEPIPHGCTALYTHPAPAGGDAGERLCQIYFEIAAEAVGEEVVRAERDRRIAALTAKPGAEGV